MSRTSTVAAVSFLVVLLLAAPSVFAAASTITFDSPHGGEVYAIGQVQTIRLGDKTKAKTVTIQLSRDGGTTFEALGTIDNTVKDVSRRNALSFTVTGPASSNCVIRATGAVGKISITVVSSPFSIGSAGPPLPGSVTSGSLAPASVTAPSIANGAVTSANIANGAVGVQQISSGAASADFVLQADGSGGTTFGPLPLDSRYVKIAGDTMKGLLTLSGDPTAGLHAATKQYVDAQVGAPSGVAPNAGNSIIAALNNAATTPKTLSAGVLTGTAGINITGNAATATTAGSAPPSGSAAGDLSGSYPNPSVASVNGQTATNIGSGVQAANNAASANTASTIVKRDASGNFAANAITANNVTLPTTTRYYSISHFEVTYDMGDGYYKMNHTATYTCLWNGCNGMGHAPVHLPHGSVITGLQAVVANTQTRTDYDIIVTLSKLQLADNATTDLQTLQTGPTAGPITLSSPSFSETVDNQNFTYTLKVTWPGMPTGFYDASALQFYNARITYTVTSPLP